MGNCLKPCKEEQPPLTSPKPLIIPPISEPQNKNLRVFTFSELKKATNKFRQDRVVIGHNGSLRTLYKRYIDETTFAPSKTGTGITVSVMECFQDSSEDIEEWKAEVRSVGEISHPNLVKLIGYCCEDNKSLLVFEYFNKGSLDTHIFGKEETLPWETRVKIAIGTAQGLAFLHSVKNRALYREIGMHNILLDENFNAKLFYLGSNKLRLFEDSITTPFIGRTDYIPPEYVISEEEALPWETRVKIAIGIAQGISFVHSIKNSPLNQELRMHNILLDEYYNAKLFYLEPKKRPMGWAFVGGTTYMSPELVTTAVLEMESDVFTFGVILLVLFTGSKDIAKNLKGFDTRSFLMGEIIDPRLGGGYPMNAATKMGTLIQRCTMWDWKKRPLMQQVLDVLNSIAEIKD